MDMEPAIVAIGGGSLNEGAGPQLEDYVLSLADAPEPRVCFIPTASGDSPAAIARFYEFFTARDCRPCHLGLFDRKVSDLAAFLRQQDVVYVGGGNTATMLAIWRLHGLDAALREAWQQGVVLAGSSAGASCWHAASVVDSFGPTTPLPDGLGFIPASFCPHYDSAPERRPVFQQSVGAGLIPAGIAAEDGVAVRYTGTEVAEIVASRAGARAWRLEQTPEGASETLLEPRLLTST